MKVFLNISFLFVFGIGFSQSVKDTVDYKYLEDQLYITLTYNLLENNTNGLTQNGLSGEFALGFIKDIPVNSTRTFGAAIGVGYAYKIFNENLKISQSGGVSNFQTATNFTKNNLKLNAIEFPLEIRWRNSTPTKYKFWRIYTGFKISYLFKNSAYYNSSSETIKISDVPELNKINYGVSVTTGFSTWNLYLYYSLNPLFKEAFLNGNKINSRELNIGLKFYIM